jgi:hypothetical protein
MAGTSPAMTVGGNHADHEGPAFQFCSKTECGLLWEFAHKNCPSSLWLTKSGAIGLLPIEETPRKIGRE